jgi:hypothetical protein
VSRADDLRTRCRLFLDVLAPWVVRGTALPAYIESDALGAAWDPRYVKLARGLARRLDACAREDRPFEVAEYTYRKANPLAVVRWREGAQGTHDKSPVVLWDHDYFELYALRFASAAEARGCAERLRAWADAAEGV